MTRLSRHRFRSNEVRLWLSRIAYNLGNQWRLLVLPSKIEKLWLSILQPRLVKTGGRLIQHQRSPEQPAWGTAPRPVGRRPRSQEILPQYFSSVKPSPQAPSLGSPDGYARRVVWLRAHTPPVPWVTTEGIRPHTGDSGVAPCRVGSQAGPAWGQVWVPDPPTRRRSGSNPYLTIMRPVRMG